MEFQDIEIHCSPRRREFELTGVIPALDLGFRQTVIVEDYEHYPSEDADLYSPGHGEYTEVTRSTETMEIWSESTGEPVLPLYNDKIEWALITQGIEEEFWLSIDNTLTSYLTDRAEYYV